MSTPEDLSARRARLEAVPAETQADLIALCEEMLADARAGRLTALWAIRAHQGRLYDWRRRGQCFSTAELLGVLELMRHETLQHIYEQWTSD